MGCAQSGEEGGAVSSTADPFNFFFPVIAGRVATSKDNSIPSCEGACFSSAGLDGWRRCNTDRPAVQRAHAGPTSGSGCGRLPAEEQRAAKDKPLPRQFVCPTRQV